ncbi:hypothetical protein [Rhodanobacter lindaniclasticus]
MTPEEKQLFNLVPDDGTGMTNALLRERLGWNQDQYWGVRNSLIDQNLLFVGRGRGGVVYRVLSDVVDIGVGGPVAALPVREESLYEPIARVLEKEWARDKRLERWLVQVTARQGRRDTGGRWSRPDLVIATQSVYPYVPGKHFDVITFEVKPADAIDVTAVYEAIAHLRAATKAYVLLHVPDAEADRLDSVVNEISSEAKKHGVGVITFDRPDNFESWNEIVEPVRQEPDPGRLNDFLAGQLETEQRDILLRWFR